MPLPFDSILPFATRALRRRRRRRAGRSALLLALVLALGVALPGEWTPQAFAAESETAECEGSPSGASESDSVEEAFATSTRPRVRQRAPAWAPDLRPRADTLLRFAAPAHRALPASPRDVESGRARRTRHQSFLI